MSVVWPTGAAMTTFRGALWVSRWKVINYFDIIILGSPSYGCCFGPQGLQWQRFAADCAYNGWGNINKRGHLVLGLPPYGCWVHQKSGNIKKTLAFGARITPIWLMVGPQGLQWQRFGVHPGHPKTLGGPWVHQNSGNIKKRRHLVRGLPPHS